MEIYGFTEKAEKEKGFHFMKKSSDDFYPQSEINIEFCIKGENINPADITKIIEISPSRSYSKGDQIKNKPVFRDHSLWEIETGFQLSFDVNNQLEIMIDMLNNKKDLIKKLTLKYDILISFIIVINFINQDKPAIYLNKEVISFANEIGADIQFDYYFYEKSNWIYKEL